MKTSAWVASLFLLTAAVPTLLIAQSVFDLRDQLNPREGVPLTPLEIQASLAIANYDPGPLDGVMGNQTRAALSELARRRGYAYSGGTIPADMHQFLFFNLAVALGGDGCEGEGC